MVDSDLPPNSSGSEQSHSPGKIATSQPYPSIACEMCGAYLSRTIYLEYHIASFFSIPAQIMPLRQEQPSRPKVTFSSNLPSPSAGRRVNIVGPDARPRATASGDTAMKVAGCLPSHPVPTPAASSKTSRRSGGKHRLLSACCGSDK